MPSHHRLHLVWRGRTDPVPALAKHLAGFLSKATALHPRLGSFLFQEPGSGPVPAVGADACEKALRGAAGTWRTGDTDRTSYRPRFFLDRPFYPPVEVTVTCGIEPLGLGAIFTPNRFDLRMRSDAGDDLPTRAVLEGLLRAAVEVFDPDFGFGGSDTVPQAPLAIFSDGVPVVGWMTYLRRTFPPVPRTFPQPAVVYPVGALGTLIVAHPEPFDEHDPGKRADVDRVGGILKAAGVLVSSLDQD